MRVRLSRPRQSARSTDQRPIKNKKRWSASLDQAGARLDRSCWPSGPANPPSRLQPGLCVQRRGKHGTGHARSMPIVFWGWNCSGTTARVAAKLRFMLFSSFIRWVSFAAEHTQSPPKRRQLHFYLQWRPGTSRRPQISVKYKDLNGPLSGQPSGLAPGVRGPSSRNLAFSRSSAEDRTADPWPRGSEVVEHPQITAHIPCHHRQMVAVG
jgi:hypothetical protein